MGWVRRRRGIVRGYSDRVSALPESDPDPGPEARAVPDQVPEMRLEILPGLSQIPRELRSSSRSRSRRRRECRGPGSRNPPRCPSRNSPRRGPSRRSSRRSSRPRRSRMTTRSRTSGRRNESLDPPFQPPRALGGYRIGRRVGLTRAGAAFEARRLATGRGVALSVVRPRWSAMPGYLARFVREAFAAGRLEHANLAPSVDVAVDRGFLLVVADSLKGTPLSEPEGRAGARSVGQDRRDPPRRPRPAARPRAGGLSPGRRARQDPDRPSWAGPPGRPRARADPRDARGPGDPPRSRSPARRTLPLARRPSPRRPRSPATTSPTSAGRSGLWSPGTREIGLSPPGLP